MDASDSSHDAEHDDSDDRLQQRRERILNRRFRDLDTSRIIDPPSVSADKGTVVLMRGILSWPDDNTFKELELRIPEMGLNVYRFSYRGHQFSCYRSVDTIASLSNLATKLEEQLIRLDKNKPIWLLAHSFAGLIVTCWICREQSSLVREELLERIEAILFFDSPVFTLVRSLKLRHPTRKSEVLATQIDSSFTDIRNTLVDRFAPIHVIRCGEDDSFLDTTETSFKHQFSAEKLTNVSELVIPDAKHELICNHPNAQATVQAIIRGQQRSA